MFLSVFYRLQIFLCSFEFVLLENVTLGYRPKRENRLLDSWRNFMIIPDPTIAAERSGTLLAWNVGLQRTKMGSSTYKLALQIWRPAYEKYKASLVNQTVVTEDIKQGTRGIYWNANMPIEAGDMIGFTNYYDFDSVVPYKRQLSCPDSNKVLYNRIDYWGRVGMNYDFGELSESDGPCRHYALQAKVKYFDDATPTQITSTTSRPSTPSSQSTSRPLVDYGGSMNSITNGVYDKWIDFMLIPDRGVKIANPGLLVGWTFFARKQKDIYLQIWRMGSSSYFWKLVGETAIKAEEITPYTKQRINLNSNDSFPVKTDDVLGFWFPGEAVVPYKTDHCTLSGRYIRNYSTERRTPGVKFVRIMSRYWGACRKYAIIAHIQEQ